MKWIWAESDKLILFYAKETAVRQDICRQQQELWATGVSTLPLLQSPRYAISLQSISGVRIDELGLMRYQFLDKE